MGFDIVAYNTLAHSVRVSITTLLKHHNLDEKNVEKSILELSKERRIQCQLLLTIMQLLDTSSKKEFQEDKVKDFILNAAVFFICDKIAFEYGTTNILGKERSNFYNSLKNALDLNKKNYPDSAALINMYKPLENFMRNFVYNEGNPDMDYIPDQPFSNAKIEGYRVEADLDKLNDTLNDLRKERRHLAEKKHLEQQPQPVHKKEAKSSGGFLSGLWGSSSSGSAAVSPATGKSTSNLPL